VTFLNFHPTDFDVPARSRGRTTLRLLILIWAVGAALAIVTSAVVALLWSALAHTSR
jgi:hypothetical protein